MTRAFAVEPPIPQFLRAKGGKRVDIPRSGYFKPSYDISIIGL